MKSHLNLNYTVRSEHFFPSSFRSNAQPIKCFAPRLQLWCCSSCSFEPRGIKWRVDSTSADMFSVYYLHPADADWRQMLHLREQECFSLFLVNVIRPQAANTSFSCCSFFIMPHIRTEDAAWWTVIKPTGTFVYSASLEWAAEQSSQRPQEPCNYKALNIV